MKANNKLTKCDSGMALITTLLLLVMLSSLLVGFFVLVTTGQQLTGGAKQQTRAFYGAEAGLEKMTADRGTLFDRPPVTCSPTPRIPSVSRWLPMRRSSPGHIQV